jgi:hypothetical protein
LVFVPLSGISAFGIRHLDFSHVRLAAVDPLISPAEWARAPLDFGHKPKCRPPLLAAGAPADRAMQTNLGQHHVNPGFRPDRHFIPVRL